MRRSSKLRLADLPRLFIGAAVQLSRLLGGEYSRVEGAHVLVRDADGRVLVVRTTYSGPAWMLPGGRVERDEPPHAAAGREAREETGLEIRVSRLLLVDARRPRETTFVFAGEVAGGTLDPQLGEIAEAGWVAVDEIKATSPRLHGLLDSVDEGRDGSLYLGIEEPRGHLRADSD